MKQIYYNGFFIYERDNGWWEIYVGGTHQRFNSLSSAKYHIDYLTK